MTERLADLVEQRNRVLERFLREQRSRLALACREMARAFAGGGVLVPFGVGPAATDAAHVAVEFMHPVVVGKRALPAVAPIGDLGIRAPRTLGAGGHDMVLTIAHGPEPAAVGAFRERARAQGLLTVAMTGEGARVPADFCLPVPHGSPPLVQEVQETAYHVLWELIHVFFEGAGRADESCVACGDVALPGRVVAVGQAGAVVELEGALQEVAVDLVEGVETGDVVLCHAGVALEKLPKAPHREGARRGEGDPTGFLYPFLGGEGQDLDSLLADVERSTLRKGADVVELRRAIDLESVAACGAAIRDRLAAGGRLIAFGNGGSSTDAQDLVRDCLDRGWPAWALTDDVATITAVGNDVGYEAVFARQLIPLGRRGDVAVAISTSGSSPNILAALDEATRRGMLTCALTGYDGGRLRELDGLDHLLVVPSDYVPRIQEAQATVYHLLLEVAGTP